MQRRSLGPNLTVSSIGLGCVVLSEPVHTDPADVAKLVGRAIELGVDFFDTADGYGLGHNEGLIGQALRPYRDRVTIATKFGSRRDPTDPSIRRIDGRPQYVAEACDASLRRLGVETIDLYYQHRVDHTVPIEETVGAMAALVHAGKVRFLGLSEAKPENIRRAHAVHPIAALQSEWSLWTRDPEETGTYATCRELGIGFVPFSPLGRGFLTAGVTSLAEIPANDPRLMQPRFQDENFTKNLRIVERLSALAAEMNVTSGELALAWLLARGDDVVPIPGTRRIKHLEKNVEATSLTLTPDQLAAIEKAVPKDEIAGDRWSDMNFVNR